MKQFWLSIAILTALFCALFFNYRYLVHFVEPLNASLTEASTSARDGDWKTASEKTQQVHKTWDDKTVYLHVLLRHCDIDQINILFGEVIEYMECKKYEDYAASSARLMIQLGLLYEMEQFSWKNIL